MDYEACLRELYGLERFGIKLGLDTVRDLLGRLGDPHTSFPAVHVTGTNGKGSVCSFLDSVLRAAGYRVGLYTSPHLVRFNERIRVDGTMVGDEDVVRLFEDVRPHAEAMAADSEAKRPTFFEVTTAMAFRHFAERRVDVAVVEVGMGGGLDATNVVRPEATVVTRIGLEHTEHLGRTTDRIAREKAGILKPRIPVVTVKQPVLGILRARAAELRCPVTVVGRDVRYTRKAFDLDGQDLLLEDGAPLSVRIPLLGTFQAENAAVAFATGITLHGRWKVSEAAILEGLRNARWPGRMHLVRRDPIVIVDGAHNAPAAEALARSLRDLFPARTCALIVGILDDKDLAGIAAHLGPLAARVVATRPRTPRAFESDELRKAFEAYAPVETIPNVREAVARTVERAARDDVIVITGSIYTAGEALDLLGGWG